MLGVTIGIGGMWNRVAKRAADRMSELTGLNCLVIDSARDTNFEHPTWLKTKIVEWFPNEESFLYFDADIWCVKPWNPAQIFNDSGKRFMAAIEPPHNAIDAECHKVGINRRNYFNAGLLLFGCHHYQVFEKMAERHPYDPWFDQTPMNWAVSEYTAFESLPQRYNTLSHGGRIPVDLTDIVNVHWCSSGSAEKVLDLQNL